MRPAHIRFMVAAPGFHTLVTHVFSASSAHLDDDAVFGVKRSLVRELEPMGPEPGRDGQRWRRRFDIALAEAVGGCGS
jgi:hydroxyquinol 1,2-dioxygenase